MAPDTTQALDMLSAFLSVGVTAFDLTLTNLAGEKVGYQPGRSLDALRKILPPLLPEAARKQQNVILRPQKTTTDAELVQLDDLNAEAAAQVAPFSFLVLCTSPGNHQAWLALKDTPPDFARRLRRGAGADPTASGATRVSGSLNFKNKYAPAFPVVTITHTNAGNVVSASALEQAGFVTPAETQAPRRGSSFGGREGRQRPKAWPSYDRCVQGAPLAHGEEKPDISRADFTWARTAYQWGHSVDAIAARLTDLSSNASKDGPKYIQLTVTRAAASVDRERGPADPGRKSL
jgi:hypothetical protein